MAKKTSSLKVFFYPGNLSGWASVAIFKLRHMYCKLIPVDYTNPFPMEEVDEKDIVAIIGYCPMFNVLEEIMGKLNIVWLIDDDIATNEYADKYNLKERLQHTHCLVLNEDTDYSICELVYMWMNKVPYEKVPYHLTLIGKYDKKNFKDRNVIPFQYAARAWLSDVRNSIQPWKRFITTPTEHDKAFLNGLIEKGKLMQMYLNKKMEQTEYSKVFYGPDY